MYPNHVFYRTLLGLFFEEKTNVLLYVNKIREISSTHIIPGLIGFSNIPLHVLKLLRD